MQMIRLIAAKKLLCRHASFTPQTQSRFT